mgnify:CR=1 FL=1
MINLKKYRIIDLTAMIRPGILKVDGRYMHGKELRRFELRQFIFELDKTFMHWIDAESHVGTHVEAPSHYLKDGKSVAELPLETFMGEALVLKFEDLKPIDGRGQPIKPAHLEKVKRGDIVLMWSPYEGVEAPYISPEAATWLAEKDIKMLGVQNVGVEAPNSMATHDNLLRNNIPIIEGLVNLDKIRKERIFYIGLPLKVYGLDSSWIRAIALEEI